MKMASHIVIWLLRGYQRLSRYTSHTELNQEEHLESNMEMQLLNVEALGIIRSNIGWKLIFKGPKNKNMLGNKTLKLKEVTQKLR